MAKDQGRTLKSVSLSDPLNKRVEARLATLGITFAEYVRHLIMQDTDFLDKIPSVMATPQEEEAIREGMEDLAAGRYTTFSSHEEMHKYFNDLMDEDEQGTISNTNHKKFRKTF